MVTVRVRLSDGSVLVAEFSTRESAESFRNSARKFGLEVM